MFCKFPACKDHVNSKYIFGSGRWKAYEVPGASSLGKRTLIAIEVVDQYPVVVEKILGAAASSREAAPRDARRAVGLGNVHKGAVLHP